MKNMFFRPHSRKYVTVLTMVFLFGFSAFCISGPKIKRTKDSGVESVSSKINWPDYIEDFPAIAADLSGNLWLATLERPNPGRLFRVTLVRNGQKNGSWLLEPENMTGIAAGAVAGLENGCFVVFPAEQNGNWRLAYAFIDSASPQRLTCRFIDCDGSNISPSAAVLGNRVCVVWESNANGRRGIWSCWVDRNGAGKPVQISKAGANSYNPCIAALGNDSLFAAWDGARDKTLNIYGAMWKNGSWETEKRLTSGARIERQPSLAVWKDQIWLAWQAQSYEKISVNNIREQMIAAARIDGDKPLAPIDLFKHVAYGNPKLLRPRIAFDKQGRLAESSVDERAARPYPM